MGLTMTSRYCKARCAARDGVYTARDESRARVTRVRSRAPVQQS